MSAAAPAPRSAPIAPAPPGGLPEPDKSTCSVFVVGEVNSGKSSVINSLAGGIVSNTSIQRETFQPIWYQFSRNGMESTVRDLSLKLEETHQSNESQRSQIKTLKEEQVGTILTHTSDENPLPIRWGLQSFALIDFPGINDAQDSEGQLFFSAIRNRIHQADLVLFVTDVKSAFSKASELAEFKKIQELVAKEHAEGHFVDLAVVVNKFDNLQHPDLEQIFASTIKVLGEVGVPADKIFKYSAHKMLVASVLHHKLDLYLPKFIAGEVQSLVQSCHLKFSAEARNRLKKEKVLGWKDIVVERDVADDLLADSDSDHEEEGSGENNKQNQKQGQTQGDDHQGDATSRLDLQSYKSVVEHIRAFQVKVAQERVDQLLKHLNKLWKPVLAAKGSSSLTEPLITNLSKVLSTYSRFQELDAAQSWESALFHNVEVPTFGWSLLANADGGPAGSPYAQHAIVRTLMRFMMEHPTIANRSFCFGTNGKAFAWDVNAWWLQFSLVQPVFTHRFYMKTLRAVFSDPRTFDGSAVDVWKESKLNAGKEKLSKGTFRANGTLEEPIQEIYGTHAGWLVSNVLNSPHTPKDARTMVLLSITPLSQLHAMGMANSLPIEIINGFDSELLGLLRFTFTRPDLFPPARPLQHQMFALDKVREVADFKSACTRFQAVAALQE